MIELIFITFLIQVIGFVNGIIFASTCLPVLGGIMISVAFIMGVISFIMMDDNATNKEHISTTLVLSSLNTIIAIGGVVNIFLMLIFESEECSEKQELLFGGLSLFTSYLIANIVLIVITSKIAIAIATDTTTTTTTVAV